MPFTASGDSWSGGVPALATTTFGAGNGLLLPLLSGQMKSSIILTPRLRSLAPQTTWRGPSPVPPAPRPASRRCYPRTPTRRSPAPEPRSQPPRVGQLDPPIALHPPGDGGVLLGKVA